VDVVDIGELNSCHMLSFRHAFFGLLGLHGVLLSAQDVERFIGARRSVGGGALSLERQAEAFRFNIVQNTCALYVAVRSPSLKAPIAFGEDLDEDMVRSNLCPWLEVACKGEPPAPKDSTRVR
jgi:hypothetical protein